MAAIKICGLTRPEDARAAELAGAFFGGVILASGSPRRVDPDAVQEIFGETSLVRCGVFVNQEPERLFTLVDKLSLHVVQLHGDETPEVAARLRLETGVETWKAIRPREGEEFSAELDRFADVVDGILLDGWSAAARGGTGVRFPWHAVAEYRHRVPSGVRLGVAGGLSPKNVGEVMAILAPDLVDVSSGVESAPGIKDENLIREFADAVRAARQGVR